MRWLDLERIDVVSELEHAFSWGVIVFVALMVVCETAAHMLTERKERLLSQPRHLSPTQYAALVHELERSAKVTVGLCSPRSRESEIFGHQIFEAFTAAGWTAQTSLADVPEAELDSGILFLSYEGNSPPSMPDFSSVERAFRAADIPYKKVRLPLRNVYTNGITTSDPVILIGKRFEY